VRSLNAIGNFRACKMPGMYDELSKGHCGDTEVCFYREAAPQANMERSATTYLRDVCWLGGFDVDAPPSRRTSLVHMQHMCSQ